MIGKLILTHGGLARELLSAAQVISGRLSAFEALSLDWNDGHGGGEGADLRRHRSGSTKGRVS